MGRDFRSRFAASSGSGSLIRLQSRCQPCLQPSQGSIWGGIHFQAHSHGCCRIQLLTKLLLCKPHFFVSCWPEAALSSLPHGPLHRATYNMELASLGQAREIESVRAKQKSVFCNLILEVTSHNFYKLLSRDNLLGIGDHW